MKALCLLWRCLGSDEAKLDANEDGTQAKAGLVDDNAACKEPNASLTGARSASAKEGKALRLEDEAPTVKGVSSDTSGAGDEACSTETKRLTSLGLPLNERVLRALLQKAKAAVSQHQAEHGPGGSLPRGADGSVSLQELHADPELLAAGTSLNDACSVPRPEPRTLLRVELLLGELRRWLAARPCPAAATALLYAAGDGLAHAEHCIRSVGQVRFWQPDAVSAFLALLQLYGDVLAQASRVAKLPGRKPLRPEEQEQETPQQKQKQISHALRQSLELQPTVGGGDPPQSPSMTDGGWRRMQSKDGTDARDGLGSDQRDSPAVLQAAAGQGKLQGRHAGHGTQQHPLAFAAAALLLRPEWLDLLSELLELLHFRQEYAAAAARAGRSPQEALSSALQLWAFLTQLAKFAASNANSVQRMAACLQRLAALLAPPDGAVPRLLALPLREDTLAAQLHALWLLQVLYDMPDAKVLYHPGVAEHYVALHHAAMVESYEASAADPHSAAAELCRIHATLLRSLARQPGQPVRAAFARARTADWLLTELSLESQLLPCAQQDAEAAAGEAEEGESDAESSGDVSSVEEGAAEGDGTTAQRSGEESGVSAGGAMSSSGGDPGAGGLLGTSSIESPFASAGGAAEEAIAEGKAAALEGRKSFAFTYDLNEDVERLIALEDKLGHALEVDGFEYDEEGRQLMARSDARQAEAAAADTVAFAAAVTAAAEAAAAAAAAQDGDQQRLRPIRVRLQGDSSDDGAGLAEELTSLEPTVSGGTGSVSTTTVGGGTGVSGNGSGPTDNGGVGGSLTGFSPSRRSSNVPRLTLASLRTASVSSMAVRSIRSSSTAVHRVLGHRASRASGASMWGGGASTAGDAETEADGGGTDGDEELPEDATTPVADPAATAERIAHWSSTLAGVAVQGPDDADAPGGGGGVPLGAAPCSPGMRSRGDSNASVASAATNLSARSMQIPESVLEDAGTPPGLAMRELTMSSPIHAGPQGELHIMTPSRGPSHGSPGPGLGKPPLPGPRPVVPPLRIGTSTLPDAGGALPNGASSRAGTPPVVGSKAMVLLSASNRANAGVWAAVAGNVQSGQPQAQTPRRTSRSSSGLVAAPSVQTSPLAPDIRSSRRASSQPSQDDDGPSSLPIRTPPLSPPSGPQLQQQQDQHLYLSVSAPPLSGAMTPGKAVGGGASPEPTARVRQPVIPVLNLASLRRGGAGLSSRGPATDTGRTVPLSSMLRGTVSVNASSIPGGSAMDSYASPPTTKASRGTGGSVVGGSIAASSPPPPDAPPSASASGRYASASFGAGEPIPFGGAAPLQRIPEAAQAPQAASYEELACRRLLYQDPATHLLLLKILLDLLVSPAGGLDPAYVPQRPADSGAPHAEYILLWHLNAPRNGGVVHELCRGAQRRSRAVSGNAGVVALQAFAVGMGPPRPTGSGDGASAPNDSAREYQGASQPSPRSQQAAPLLPNTRSAAAASDAVASLARPGAITRTLRLLSRPLFDAARYSNLQFVARGAYGGIYRARMEPSTAPPLGQPDRLSAAQLAEAPVAQARAGAVQVVIKTIPLPSSPFESCVLADVFGEVSIMERFTGHECICQLLDYGMHDDAYWIVMRRYRCSLAEWRARQRPLGDAAAPPAAALPAVRAAACVYLSALAQVVGALRLLASHNVVHFDLKCSNVLIEPLPGVRDGELWAPVGGTAASAAAHGAISASIAAGDGGGGSTDQAGSGGRGGGCSTGGHVVPFRCVLADFGEARAYRSAAEAFTARNRGTEVFKSPEMLLMDAAGRGNSMTAAAGAALSPSGSLQRPPSGHPPLSPANKLPSGSAAGDAAGQLGRPPSRPTSASAAGNPQRRHVLAGAGLASDIWSLGCLAYELLSGTVLFAGDYASVTHRVAFGTGERLTLTEAERARLGRLPQLVGLVEWILARDPAKRPSLEQIQIRIQQARAELGACA